MCVMEKRNSPNKNFEWDDYMVPRVHIIDSLMGTGKSTWAINFINSHLENRYIVVTEYLEEASRFQEACPEARFIQPDDKYSKMSDFLQHLKEGENIAISHKLFTDLKITDQVRKLIYDYGYILIIDETIDVIEDLKKSESDINMLIRDNHIKILEDGYVKWIDKEYSGEFDNLRNRAESGTLILIDNKMLAWLLSKSTLKAFNEIYVLTFNFDGSQMRNYLEVFEIPYNIFHIDGNELIPGKQDLSKIKSKLRSLITIYEGPMNNIGESDKSLSASWYKNNSKSKIAVMNNAYNFFRHIQKCTADDSLWTCFSKAMKTKNTKKSITVNGYTSSFESCNARAINKWRDRHNLAYLVNVYPNPEIVKWFSEHDSPTSINGYALNQLLQWIWRSAIRENEPITIYLPSKRMRTLLIDFLAGKNELAA